VVEPYLPTVSMARLVERAGSQAQREAILGPVIEGRMRLALACAEDGSRYDLAAVSATARRDAGGWILDGEKLAAIGAPQADRIVVTARTSGKPGEAGGVSSSWSPRRGRVTLRPTARRTACARPTSCCPRRAWPGRASRRRGSGPGGAGGGARLRSALLCAEASAR